MDTQTDMDKVIARIQKLFARTSRAGEQRGGATEAEAETAMRMAQELMAKYNLDMAQIEAAARPGADAGAQRTKEEVSSRTRYEWQRQLAKYVAEAHFCYHLVKEDYVRDENGDIIYLRGGMGKAKRKATHVFVGRTANVITAQLMFHYLVDTVEQLAPTEDNRVKVGRIGHATYKGDHYRIKIIDGPRFQRCDAHDATTIYDTISEAAAAITGKTANGYVFFNLGEASTAESWKKGAADRLCERLAKRRQDLIEQHDARVKQAEEDARAERERRAAEARAASERRLGADAQAEADAAVDALRAGARRAAAAPSGLEAERPPEGEDDAAWTPGEGAEDAPTVETTVLVLASAYDASEQEANYELAHGLEPGTLAKRRAAQEKWEREWAREWEERQAARAAAGESIEREEPVREETEKQRLRREAREAKEMAADRKRWARENEREARKQERALAKVDHRAYREGQDRGSKIGLDVQIERESNQKKIGGGK